MILNESLMDFAGVSNMICSLWGRRPAPHMLVFLLHLTQRTNVLMVLPSAECFFVHAQIMIDKFYLTAFLFLCKKFSKKTHYIRYFRV